MNGISSFNEDTKIAGMEDYDVFLANEFINNTLPISAIMFPGSDMPCQFYQTRDTLADMERYKSFVDNCIRRFRKSRLYKSYKAYLMGMGMNRCQINGNIEDGMADIEMHHNFLTIFDITILISQHVLNTIGRCTTFDIVTLLGEEHKNNNIPIVMLSETAHQLYHDNPDFYIPISMTFGKWWDLLIKYRYGITLDIAYKVVKYINACQRNNELVDIQFFNLANEIRSWGDYNEHSTHNYNDWNPNANNSLSYLDSNPFDVQEPVQQYQQSSFGSSGFQNGFSQASSFGSNIYGGYADPYQFIFG